MNVGFSSVIIYAKDTHKIAEFYTKYFGFDAVEEKGIIALTSEEGVEQLLIHQAGSAVKMGQACIKLVFTVSDVEKFKASALKKGLKFGATHKGDGYLFSNAKDPNKNNVCISSRGV